MPDPGPQILPASEQAIAVLGATLKLGSFFPHFSLADASKLFPFMSLRSYPADFTVFEEGDNSREMYVIVKGKVSVRKRKILGTRELAQLGPGDLFGEMALLVQTPRSASIVTLEESHILRLTSRDLDYLLKNHTELSTHLQDLARQRIYGQ